MIMQNTFPGARAATGAVPPVELWTEVLVPDVLRFRHLLVAAHARHSDAVFAGLGIERGMHVFDAGCGFGDTSIRLAEATGTKGEVLGVDCCQAFLDHAWHAAGLKWAPNVSFARRDIERSYEMPRFDLVFSRFGTMYFLDPVAGLSVLRTCLRPGGRIAHIVWRGAADNPWLTAGAEIVRRHLPAVDHETAQGPDHFSMADEATTRARMAAAGFTDIDFRRIDAKVPVGQDIPEAVAFQLALGTAGDALRAAGPAGEARRPEIEAALAEMFREVIAREGGLRMDSSSWLVTAKIPG